MRHNHDLGQGHKEGCNSRCLRNPMALIYGEHSNGSIFRFIECLNLSEQNVYDMFHIQNNMFVDMYITHSL